MLLPLESFVVLMGALLIFSLAHFPLCNAVFIYLFSPRGFYIELATLSHILLPVFRYKNQSSKWKLLFMIKKNKSSGLVVYKTKGNYVQVDLTFDIITNTWNTRDWQEQILNKSNDLGLVTFADISYFDFVSKINFKLQINLAKIYSVLILCNFIFSSVECICRKLHTMNKFTNLTKASFSYRSRLLLKASSSTKLITAMWKNYNTCQAVNFIKRLEKKLKIIFNDCLLW